MRPLKCFQIYYSPESKKNCYHWADQYFNEKCTIFFENQVIRYLIEQGKHKESEYFAVLSHMHNLKLPKKDSVTPERIEKFIQEKNSPDLISFHAGSAANLFPKANRYHSRFMQKFQTMLKIGLGVDMSPNFVPDFYFIFNSFVAKSDVYERYVTECLAPIMDAMQNDTELNRVAMEDAKYQVANIRFQQNPKLKSDLGLNYYPYAPFLLERLPSWYFSGKGLRYEVYK